MYSEKEKLLRGPPNEGPGGPKKTPQMHLEKYFSNKKKLSMVLFPI